MKKIYFSFFIILFHLSALAEVNTGTIKGTVSNNGKPIPFASVAIKGTTLGTTANEYGKYEIESVPVGNLFIVASAVGYKSSEKDILVAPSQTYQLNFLLKEDVLGLNEVVVTGNRNATAKSRSAVIVNTISPKVFSVTQSVTFGESLNFVPGLRTEDNCQNCGFSQVRMNGLEGPYSQILIDSRPIFNGLASVYGLELIPSNMIRKIEVVRGGGSVLYGSNAIAGTINILLKEPVSNSYQIDISSAFDGVGLPHSGSPGTDNHIAFNTSLVSHNYKTGFAIFGFHRNRSPFDANGDGFSELPKIINTTLGARYYQRLSSKTKLSFDFFNINEERRGGDRFDYPLHEAYIAEAVKHRLIAASADFKYFLNLNNLLSAFISTQHINRDSYYGANQSLSDYGNTRSLTYNTGLQYKAMKNGFTFISGIENTGSTLKDLKLGYPDYAHAVIVGDTIQSIPHTDNVLIADQLSNTIGIFGQGEYQNGNMTLTAGLRLDHYLIKDLSNTGNNVTGSILSPRINILYNINPFLQARMSYSRGYRAPQIFDEDLHIETSGSRQVIHRNAPGLKAETSNSFMLSMEWNQSFHNVFVRFLAEGFYTRLNNPFVNEFGTPDAEGVVVYTRTNSAGGATVRGVNLELNLIPSKNINLSAGFTLQSSRYDQVQEFDVHRFFRTPDDYGYFTADMKAGRKIGISATLNYTGSMLVPYFGPRLADPEKGQLNTSTSFWDAGLKIRYNFSVKGTEIEIYSGMKNIFNAYQKDLDIGKDRDPAYIYGPALPRTIYFGLKLGNLLSNNRS